MNKAILFINCILGILAGHISIGQEVPEGFVPIAYIGATDNGAQQAVRSIFENSEIAYYMEGSLIYDVFVRSTDKIVAENRLRQSSQLRTSWIRFYSDSITCALLDTMSLAGDSPTIRLYGWSVARQKPSRVTVDFDKGGSALKAVATYSPPLVLEQVDGLIRDRYGVKHMHDDLQVSTYENEKMRITIQNNGGVSEVVYTFGRDTAKNGIPADNK